MTASEYLWNVWTWNEKHPDESDPLHAPSLDVAAAMYNDTFPDDDNTGYEMQKTLKGFQGRYYNDIVKAKKAANGDFKVFSDKVEAMYVEYQADIAEYEASKAEQAEEEKGEEDAPAEETPVK